MCASFSWTKDEKKNIVWNHWNILKSYIHSSLTSLLHDTISSQILEIIKQPNGMTTWVLDTTFQFKTLNKYLRNELKRLHISLHFAFSLLCIHNFYNILLFLWDTQPANATNYMLFLKKQSFIKWCFQSQILKAVGEIKTESWNFNEELEIEQKVANELDLN